MQKKRTKLSLTKLCRTFAAVAAVLFLFVLAAPNATARAEIYESVNGHDVRVIDNANLLTDSEEQRLFDEIRDMLQHGNIIFYTETDVSGSTGEYIKYWYNSQYGNNSGTVFFIDMLNRQIYIFSNGRNYSVISKSVADNITDKTWTYARNGEYYECASKTFDQIRTVLDGGRI